MMLPLIGIVSKTIPMSGNIIGFGLRNEKVIMKTVLFTLTVAL